MCVEVIRRIIGSVWGRDKNNGRQFEGGKSGKELYSDSNKASGTKSMTSERRVKMSGYLSQKKKEREEH